MYIYIHSWMAEGSSYQTTRRTPISDTETKTNLIDNLYECNQCEGTGTFPRQSQHIRFISMKNRLVPHQESSRDSRKFPLRVGGRSPQVVFQVSGYNCAQLVAHQTQIFFHRSSPKMVSQKNQRQHKTSFLQEKNRNRVSKKNERSSSGLFPIDFG